jgi:hypothetical protein
VQVCWYKTIDNTGNKVVHKIFVVLPVKNLKGVGEKLFQVVDPLLTAGKLTDNSDGFQELIITDRFRAAKKSVYLVHSQKIPHLFPFLNIPMEAFPGSPGADYPEG